MVQETQAELSGRRKVHLSHEGIVQTSHAMTVPVARLSLKSASLALVRSESRSPGFVKLCVKRRMNDSNDVVATVEAARRRTSWSVAGKRPEIDDPDRRWVGKSPDPAANGPVFAHEAIQVSGQPPTGEKSSPSANTSEKALHFRAQFCIERCVAKLALGWFRKFEQC